MAPAGCPLTSAVTVALVAPDNLSSRTASSNDLDVGVATASGAYGRYRDDQDILHARQTAYSDFRALLDRGTSATISFGTHRTQSRWTAMSRHPSALKVVAPVDL